MTKWWTLIPTKSGTKWWRRIITLLLPILLPNFTKKKRKFCAQLFRCNSFVLQSNIYLISSILFRPFPIYFLCSSKLTEIKKNISKAFDLRKTQKWITTNSRQWIGEPIRFVTLMKSFNVQNYQIVKKSSAKWEKTRFP